LKHQSLKHLNCQPANLSCFQAERPAVPAETVLAQPEIDGLPMAAAEMLERKDTSQLEVGLKAI